MRTVTRHAQREIAFQVLYSLYFTRAASLEDLQERFVTIVRTAEDEARDGVKDKGHKDRAQKAGADAEAAAQAGQAFSIPKTLDFAWKLVRGVWEFQDALDQLVQKNASRSLDRIGRVELVILRMGTYELLTSRATDPKITLSESIILAQDFGEPASHQFINGILHSTATMIQQDNLNLLSLQAQGN